MYQDHQDTPYQAGAQRAKFATKSAWLGTEFGEDYARKLFGDATVDALPRYSRGKNAGKLKGKVEWLRCVEGGWVSEGYDPTGTPLCGGVERRRGVVVRAYLYGDSWDEKSCVAGWEPADTDYSLRTSGYKATFNKITGMVNEVHAA